MKPPSSAPFFIGWENKPAPRFVVGTTVIAILVATAIAGLLAASQSLIGPATWDFAITEHRGILLSHPAPMLLEKTSGGGHALRFLVKPEKFGFAREELDQYHLKPVTLQASLLENGPRSILEVSLGSIAFVEEGAPAGAPLQLAKQPGSLTLRGEIIDSKCYLGAMNPGERKTHRACAIHCLRGGIPAAFLARDLAGREAVLLLTDPAGAPLGPTLLDFVAEPVEATGTLSFAGDLAVFAIDLANLRRLNSR
jgi:hypothetical protein